LPGIKVVPAPIVILLFTVIPATAVLLFPVENIRLLYAIAFIFCAPVPLKFTVLGAEELVFKVPAVMVSALATPKTELADNCSDVPLTVVLKRFAVPLKVDVPVKVAVPADAVILPAIFIPDVIEKSTAVVIVPVTDNRLKLFIPAPDIVFDVPLMVTAPALAVKLPLTDKLPVRVKDIAVVTVPLTVRLSNEIPEPLIVFPDPVIVSVPPEAWLNEPEPVVARLPVNPILPFKKLISEDAIVRLLKF
jgi:hypothetical protein